MAEEARIELANYNNDELEKELESLKEKSLSLSSEMIERTGYSENPLYGAPTGKTTARENYLNFRRNYSSPPNREVQVLASKFMHCRNCGDEVKTREGSSYQFVHSNGESKCSNVPSKTASPQSSCTYCGTSDPTYQSFSHQSYSDESTCGRCGGVNGYGIGD